MADTEIAGAVKAALAHVEIPGGGALAGYSGLSEINAAKAAAEAVSQGRKVMVSLTSDKSPALAPTGQAAAQGRPAPAPRSPVPGVRNIIVVGSGKGGVRRSRSFWASRASQRFARTASSRRTRLLG
jgi:ATP-binding protein involved in chromosome partitioning